MLVSRVVEEPHPAFRAQAEAIFLTDRLERQRQNHCVPDYRFKIHVVVLNLILESFVLRIREKLLNIDFDRVLDVDEAPNTLASCSRIHLSAHQDAVVQRLQAQVEVHGSPFRHADHGVAEALRGWDVQLPFTHLARSVHDVAHVERPRGLL